MADRGKFFTIRENETAGGVRISEEVLAIIAGLAATEVKGVAALDGGATKDKIAKLGIKKLRPGIRIEVLNGVVTADLTIQIGYGYSIVDVGTQVQERVKTAIESMTGMTVSDVNIHVADVSVKESEAQGR